MCGRVELDLEISNPAMQRLTELLKKNFPNESIVSGEKYPSDLLPIFKSGKKNPNLTLMHWGFPMKNSHQQMINARTETVTVKPTFRDSFYNRRCILPTTGFYEWSHNGNKHKFLFRLKNDPMLYLGCLYTLYEQEERFVILTQQANNSVADVHQRMPLIIPQSKIIPWIEDQKVASQIIRLPGPELIKFAQ